MSREQAPKPTDGLDFGFDPTRLMGGEAFWGDHYEWLRVRGYKLRPRYKPGWKPSWVSKEGKVLKASDECEDGQWLRLSNTICDATRMSDGTYVILKLIRPSEHPYEIDISTFLSSEVLASDRRNHCVPIYEVLKVSDVKDRAILVMPFLRSYNDPPFQTFGEAVDCIRQLIEGLEFMHTQHVAHRDCMSANIMMEGLMYPRGWHLCDDRMNREYTGRAKYYTRTQRPPKYCLIDFGISCRYNAEDLPVLEVPIHGGDRTVPEFQHSVAPCDPFATDIYYLGNVFRMDFMLAHKGFEFMDTLVAEMVQDDPAKRPTMGEVARRFDGISETIDTKKLRSRLVSRDERSDEAMVNFVLHWYRRLKYALQGYPAIPSR